MTIRYPAVAGMFYPNDADELRAMLENFFEAAKQYANLPVPKAIIAPHAGYIYSGQIAAAAYACLQKVRQQISRVVILAPAHRYPVDGIAATQFDYFVTPLGKVNVDHVSADKLIANSQANIIENAFNAEHAIEVQIPFLQMMLKDFSIIPLLIGVADAPQVAAVLRELWGGDETLIVVSSDLSHYHAYKRAQEMDRNTANAILQLNPGALDDDNACGVFAVRGLLQIALEKKLRPVLIDLCNSGDTAGSKDQVVGYGAFHFLEK
jgi:MEMO1 family protein